MTRIGARLAAATLAALSLATPASAYWEYGHQTIAQIAMANVTPRTKTAVRRLLARSAVLDTPTCPATTIEDASVWADCVKPLKGADGKSRFGYAYGWHFQDVEICRPFTLADACKDGNCVSAQITRDVATLRDRRAATKDKVQALVFLIHFVGDLHQPLHAGEKADQGGNKVAAAYGIYEPKRFNLHSIWDGPLAERAATSGPSLVRRFPVSMRAKVAAGTVTDWSRESWQVAHDSAYASALHGDPCGPTPAHVTLSDADIAALVPVARLEIERGGLRLAKELDRALG
ncbi:S1/P1 nuclease [Sphingomonas bacterium]|uniref:S1/P1 nuclease n=1 Tax=Sphingomonas bacterium TaxID=1895847 RepID=UPI0015758C45|nr:S1/P1 nuclease [Sphingomonas bacterium]